MVAGAGLPPPMAGADLKGGTYSEKPAAYSGTGLLYFSSLM